MPKGCLQKKNIENIWKTHIFMGRYCCPNTKPKVLLSVVCEPAWLGSGVRCVPPHSHTVTLYTDSLARLGCACAGLTGLG